MELLAQGWESPNTPDGCQYNRFLSRNRQKNPLLETTSTQLIGDDAYIEASHLSSSVLLWRVLYGQLKENQKHEPSHKAFDLQGCSPANYAMAIVL